MEANELRIGNYIEAYGYVANVTTIDDEIIEFNPISDKDGSLPEYNYIRTEDCNPIPITKEWLGKFELKESSYIDQYTSKFDLPDERFTIHLASDGNHKIIFSGNELTFVHGIHQLQNLYFALTGEELMIEE